MAQDFPFRSPPRHGGREPGRRTDNQTAARDQDRSAPTIELGDIRFGEGLDPRLFADIAEAKARAIADTKSHLNKRSQLRRFYDELAMWQEKVGGDDGKFREYEPYIRMMKAKVAYAKGREYVDVNFQALFGHVIDRVTNATTLRHAKLFMEAFMAFYRVWRSN